MENKQRIKKINELIKKNNLDFLFISSLKNVTYLSLFTGTSGIIIHTPSSNYFITDSRYVERAREEVENYKVIITKDGYLEEIINIVKKYNNVKTFGFEDGIKFKDYRTIKEKIGLEMFPVNLENIRMIKQPEEVNNIKKAVLIAERAFKNVINNIKPGVIEKEIADELNYQMKKYGAEESPFQIIVASGIKTSRPHAKTDEKIIKKGEVIVVDWGCSFKGYNSDLTRIIVIGKVDEDVLKVYKMLKIAQDKAIEKIKSGEQISEVDILVREILKKDGLEKYFTHNLGHGIGLNIHEPPHINSKAKGVFKNGMVFTIEPGIYFPGDWGLRVEDTITIKKDISEKISTLGNDIIQL